MAWIGSRGKSRFKRCGLLLGAVISFSGQVNAQNDQLTAKSFFWRQCTENVIMLHLDPGPFAKLVGKDFTVRLIDGRAWVMLVVQDCHNNFFDGEDIGPAQEFHAWLSIVGSRDNEITPVFGAEKTINTLSWFYLFNGSTNAKARALYGRAGILSNPIEKLSLNLTPSLLNGQLAVGPDAGFSWRAAPKEPLAKKMGVNFEIFARDELGNIVRSQVQALLLVKSWYAPGTLEVKGGIGPDKFVGPGTYPVFINSYNPILVRAMLGVAPAK
jgi:hypothetical protein